MAKRILLIHIFTKFYQAMKNLRWYLTKLKKNYWLKINRMSEIYQLIHIRKTSHLRGLTFIFTHLTEKFWDQSKVKWRLCQLLVKDCINQKISRTTTLITNRIFMIKISHCHLFTMTQAIRLWVIKNLSKMWLSVIGLMWRYFIFSFNVIIG